MNTTTKSVNEMKARRIESHQENIFAHSDCVAPAKIVKSSKERDLEEISLSDTLPLDEVYTVKKKRTWLKVWLFLALVAITVETGLSIWQAFESSFVVGGIYASLAALSVGLIGRFIFSELKALVQLKKHDNVRLDASRLLESEQIGEAQSWIDSQLKSVELHQAEQFKKLIQPHHTDKERLVLFDKEIMESLDSKAQKTVASHSAGTAMLVALSPMATVDMFAVLWRGAKMIEAVSRLYGIRLGYRSRIRLYKMLLQQMVFVGGTELVSDLAATALGAELLGKLSARSAQGLSAGIFTARLGLKTMELCRPIPHFQGREKRLKHIVKELLLRVKEPALEVK
ncbi:hypothetical protein PALB_33080 [Pseudoalteromonas luteoviolacea B = ATCC 29581]|nr:hypothetical protein PALB_33080 [Pseudoalteromonas luteoviolacea B = ATCC 29581]